MSGTPSVPKRAWKLQEFVGHAASVTCLSLGHKSGRVLVTGGEDKKVNLWAVGKPSCIMSLSGHNTSIECVRFGSTEELVCAGSQSGAVKIWDLEAAKLLRTLTGHKSGVKCIDFHPYGDFLCTGSSDTSLRLWDTRRKGCIFSYKGHTSQINSVKFSPDGQWIASAGEEGEGVIKIWDLRAGKQITQLSGHSGSITDVEFHPHEFLLASGSDDRSICFWDLETMSLIGGGGDVERSGVRCILFHPEGDCLFSGSMDMLRLVGWEPINTLDTLPIGWGKVSDIAVASNQLIGASYHGSHVQLWVVDLKKVRMNLGGVLVPEKDTGKVTVREHPVRRSFVKEKTEPGMKAVHQQMRIEECSDKSGTDGDESDAAASAAEITNLNHYENIFRPRQRELNRTPPVEEPFEDPGSADMPQPVRAADPMNFHGPNGPGGNTKSRPSPVGLRRSSQPTLPSGYSPGSQQSGRRGSSAGVSGDLMKPQDLHVRPGSTQGPRPSSLYDGGGGGSSPMRAGYRTSVNLGANSETQEYLPQRPYSSHHPSQPPAPSSPVKASYPTHPPYVPEMTPGPPSPTKTYPAINLQAQPPPPAYNSRPGAPLDRPTQVRRSPPEPAPVHPGSSSYLSPQAEHPARKSVCEDPDNPDNIKLIPSMSDKPTGLSADDFLPNQFGKMSVSQNMAFGWPQTELSESEVTSSILKGHSNMMAVLSARSRNINIVRQMWHSKDTKTAAEQAVAFNDQSVIVDLLSVIVLRSSIWTLDLCNILLPAIGQLLLSKYESYVNHSASALKLILKNFATVIKSNIDSPGSSVGVDISKEERANKCMECYRELVKIRSGILKRQTMQGKAGHAYRELAILMQYLD